MDSLRPVAEGERLHTLDVLRGLSLVGILLMNIEWYSRPTVELGHFNLELTGIDYAVAWFVKVFVEGKFYKLFALLFGMGFAVMLARAKAAGRPYVGWFTRRMLFLFLLGLAHQVLIWDGDILHDYATGGLVLLGVVLLLSTRRLQHLDQPQRLFRIALVWLALPFMIATVVGIGFGLSSDRDRLSAMTAERQELVADSKALVAQWQQAGSPSADTPVEDEGLDAEVRRRAASLWRRAQRTEREQTIYRASSYWETVRFRLELLPAELAKTPFFVLAFLLPLLLVGYALVAGGYVSHPDRHPGLFRSLCYVGLGLGLPLNVASQLVRIHPAIEFAMPVKAAADSLFMLGQWVLAAGYLGLVVLLMQSLRWRPKLEGFAPMGRMALTNYILHSLILTTVFYGYAGGYYGELSRSVQVLLALAILIAQFWLSAWWLARFRFGPLEWLWRSATYLDWQALRRPSKV